MPSHRVPKLCFHKASGLGVVRLDGRDVYLGSFDDPDTKRQYDRLIGEWLARGRRLPDKADPTGGCISVGELIVAFMTHARAYYSHQDGEATSEHGDFKRSLRPLRTLYESLPCDQFSPLKYKAVVAEMVKAGWSRRVVNQRASRIKRMFRWAVANELVPESVYSALRAVPSLAKGRCPGVPDHPPVEAVSVEILNATLPHLTSVVRSMVELQLAVGCRPQEICLITPGQVDRSNEIWLYRPSRHKTAWRGRVRVIPIGPKGQAILAPFLDRPADAYCFSPVESVAETRLRRRAEATWTVRRKKKPSAARGRKPTRPPGDHYTTSSYTKSIYSAARKAGVEPWSPNRLRHLRASQVRVAFGLEAAASILGHADTATTLIYAKGEALAEEVARKIG